MEILWENRNLEWNHSKESLPPEPGTESKQGSRSGCSSFVGGVANPKANPRGLNSPFLVWTSSKAPPNPGVTPDPSPGSSLTFEELPELLHPDTQTLFGKQNPFFPPDPRAEELQRCSGAHTPRIPLSFWEVLGTAEFSSFGLSASQKLHFPHFSPIFVVCGAQPEFFWLFRKLKLTSE